MLSRIVTVLAMSAAAVLAVPGLARAQAPANAMSAAPAIAAALDVRGFSMQLNDPSPGSGEVYKKAIDDMADMGCTWINFVVAARQDNVKSEAIHINLANMPSYATQRMLLRHAKKRGVRTMLMPIVLLDHAGSKEWRGVIAPPSWDNWFDSYTLFVLQYAAMAKECNVDIFCVGSELLSTESFRERWLNVIGKIKETYKGKLTYSANWDHYTVPKFWDKLDYIGMNNYNELAKEPGASVDELVKAWDPIKQSVLAFGKKMNKPIFFTEVGWHNLQNTISEPWNYVADGPIDNSEQLHAYQAFVKAWQDVPPEQFNGAMIWEWKPGAQATDHGTYSLQGSPAMEVVKKWMRRN